MTIGWRPSVAEERWLEVAANLGEAGPDAVTADRAGGWRSTGPLARIALFVLGVAAAGLLLLVLDFNDEASLIIAGVLVTLVAEWLMVGKRLHRSGIEEGLCVAGSLLIAIWIATQLRPHGGWGDGQTLLLIVATAVAGLRLLNPLVTTCAVVAFAHWAASTELPRALDQATVWGSAALVFGCAAAMLALALGAREYRRPSHDRMLDWLVAALPIATYPLDVVWSASTAAHLPYDLGRLGIVALLVGTGAVLLITGVRRRRRAPLLGFVGCVVGLAVECRFLTVLATEVRLVLGGVAMLAAAVVLDRYLRRPRKGITSAALSNREAPIELLQLAGAALQSHRATPEPVAAEPEAIGGGGRFGGGGATGTF